MFSAQIAHVQRLLFELFKIRKSHYIRRCTTILLGVPFPCQGFRWAAMQQGSFALNNARFADDARLGGGKKTFVLDTRKVVRLTYETRSCDVRPV